MLKPIPTPRHTATLPLGPAPASFQRLVAPESKLGQVDRLLRTPSKPVMGVDERDMLADEGAIQAFGGLGNALSVSAGVAMALLAWYEVSLLLFT